MCAEFIKLGVIRSCGCSKNNIDHLTPYLFLNEDSALGDYDLEHNWKDLPTNKANKKTILGNFIHPSRKNAHVLQSLRIFCFVINIDSNIFGISFKKTRNIGKTYFQYNFT